MRFKKPNVRSTRADLLVKGTPHTHVCAGLEVILEKASLGAVSRWDGCFIRLLDGMLQVLPSASYHDTLCWPGVLAAAAVVREMSPCHLV